jgi:hypothetical protein
VGCEPEGKSFAQGNVSGTNGHAFRLAFGRDRFLRQIKKESFSGKPAQTSVPPSERRVDVDGLYTDLKLDVRAYAYAGRIQLLAARLYQGRTTNFRTAGGGFAPLFVIETPATPTPETRTG